MFPKSTLKTIYCFASKTIKPGRNLVRNNGSDIFLINVLTIYNVIILYQYKWFSLCCNHAERLLIHSIILFSGEPPRKILPPSVISREIIRSNESEVVIVVWHLQCHGEVETFNGQPSQVCCNVNHILTELCISNNYVNCMHCYSLWSMNKLLKHLNMIGIVIILRLL